MSGAALPNRDVADGRELTAILAQQLGIEPTLPAFASVAPQALADAQDAAAAELGRRQPSLRLAWGPLIDGEVVSGMGGLKPGAGVDRLMAGATAEEFNALVGREGSAVDEERMRRRMVRMGLGPDAIDAYRATMPDAAPAWVLGQATTDSWFRAPTLGLVDTWAERGGRAWLYSFEWVSRSSLALGSVHCLDVPFFFDNLASPGVEEVAGPTPQPLADVMHRAVVDFVKGADPGWPHWEPGREPAVVYDDPPRVVEHPWPLVRSSWFAGSASAAN
jgi:para-nitrobenzyl esterase